MQINKNNHNNKHIRLQYAINHKIYDEKKVEKQESEISVLWFIIVVLIAKFDYDFV
jgi:hypothetical protein